MKIEETKRFTLHDVTEYELIGIYKGLSNDHSGVKFAIRSILGYEPGVDGCTDIVNPHLNSLTNWDMQTK